jgi:hypothetical protein
MTLGNFSSALSNDLNFTATQVDFKIGSDTRPAQHCYQCIYGYDSENECTNPYGVCGIGQSKEEKRVRSSRRRLKSHESL